MRDEGGWWLSYHLELLFWGRLEVGGGRGGEGVPAGLGVDRGLRPLSPPTANPPDPTPTEYPCPRAAWLRQTPLS